MFGHSLKSPSSESIIAEWCYFVEKEDFDEDDMDRLIIDTSSTDQTPNTAVEIRHSAGVANGIDCHSINVPLLRETSTPLFPVNADLEAVTGDVDNCMADDGEMFDHCRTNSVSSDSSLGGTKDTGSVCGDESNSNDEVSPGGALALSDGTPSGKHSSLSKSRRKSDRVSRLDLSDLN